MSRHGNARLNPKRDGNEGEIITALEQAGCTVHQINGKGVCDLLVCTPAPEHKTILVEVKQPRGELTEAQIKFHQKWPGEKYIVTTPLQVSEILKA
jgi:hypothetical protein